MWCESCYAKHLKDDFPNSGKELVVYWEGEFEGRYEKVRTGDHLLTNIHCDLCHFRKMKGRDPAEGSDKDEKLLIAVRRASLNALCNR